MLASRYGATGMAEAVVICVVVMEGLFMVPMAYRRLEDSVLAPGTPRPAHPGPAGLVTGGLAWVLGRAGGPLYVFADTHGRVLGLTAVAGAAIALFAVFYALLLVSLPPVQRRQLLTRSRSSLWAA